MKILTAILVSILPMAASAFDLIMGAGIGHQQEMRYRLGPRFQLSEHWIIDSGASLIVYKPERYPYGGGGLIPRGYVWAVDGKILREIELGGSLYATFGTGISTWSTTKWGAQIHGRDWLFANQIGLNWIATPKTEIGLFVSHDSGLWCKPNTSIDFVGLQVLKRL
jgi:hypothetical protein